MRPSWGYAYYTMFDYISVFVNRGEITLTGSVTPDFDKAAALFERVAKVHGVQDVRTTIEILPVSQMDADLRSAIASRVFNDDLFERYSTRTTSAVPYHRPGQLRDALGRGARRVGETPVEVDRTSDLWRGPRGRRAANGTVAA